MTFRTFLPALLACACLAPAPLRAQWTNIMPDKDLSGWESVGDGLWNVTSDGILVGQRNRKTAKHQAWLLTRKDFRQYDLRLTYWIRYGANSGISIRDTSRAAFACGDAHDPKRTPSHIGYEIQILGAESKTNPTGSLYLFKDAASGHEKLNDWNEMEIQVRDSLIRVILNGVEVMQHPGDPERSKTGPVGIQLHDPDTVLMLKRIEVREIR